MSITMSSSPPNRSPSNVKCHQAMMIEIAKKMMAKGEGSGATVHADDLPPTQVCVQPNATQLYPILSYSRSPIFVVLSYDSPNLNLNPNINLNLIVPSSLSPSPYPNPKPISFILTLTPTLIIPIIHPSCPPLSLIQPSCPPLLLIHPSCPPIRIAFAVLG